MVKWSQGKKYTEVPMYYGGIDHSYGNLNCDAADKILDLIDEYIELVEVIGEQKHE